MDGYVWRIFALLLFLSTCSNAFQIRHSYKSQQRSHPTRHHHGRLKRQHDGPGEAEDRRSPGFDFADSNSEPLSFIWGGPRAEEGEGSGRWGPWEAPSSCSRSCGGGVASQARRCNDYSEDGQPLCRGADLRYFSCNIQPCPPGATDFRAQQCSEFDERLFNDRYYRWLPYIHSVGKCELNCMPQNERFYYRHRRKVTDGTSCDDETGAICVDGKCIEVGCDKLLGSKAREDVCGVCWGDGSSCVTKSASYDVNSLKPGYNDILLIPAGATNIKVRESQGSNNYLAMRNATGHYFFNGNYRIDYPRDFDIAGTKFHYERPEHKIQAPQSITAKGPTREGVYLVILFQDRGPPVDYEYSVPRDIAPRSDPHTYSWVYGQFSECSSSCGGGYQTRSVACVRTSDNEQADEELCEFGLRPAGSQQCAPDPCPPAWVTDEWQPCSESCGGNGTQTRQVYCGQVIAGGVPSVVGDHICVEKDGPKPATSQPCGREVICPTWHVGPWKPCNRLCGDGVQRRDVTCFARREGKIEVLQDAYCRSDKPDTEKPCNLHPCDGVDWVTSEWSGCDESCGLTDETREVQCATKNGDIYPDKFCHGYRKPKLKRKCKASKECDFEWFASQWSKCSAKCGTGVQTRKVFCSTMKNDTLTIVEDSKCDAKLKYETTQNCTATDKCQGAWYYGPWSECSAPCGGGNKTRKAVCVMENSTVDWKHCDSEKFQLEKDFCNKQPCEESSTTESSTDIAMTTTNEPTEEPSSEEEECEVYEDEEEETSETPTDSTDEGTESTESITTGTSEATSESSQSTSAESSTVGSVATIEAATEGSTATGATEATATVGTGNRSGVSVAETVQSDAPSSGATDGTSAASTAGETSTGSTAGETSAASTAAETSTAGTTAAESTSEASTTESATSTTVASTTDATTTDKVTTVETTTEGVTSTAAVTTTTEAATSEATTLGSISSSSSSGTEALTTAGIGSSTDGSTATDDSSKATVESSSVPSTIGETTTEGEKASKTTGTAGTEETSESSPAESSTTKGSDLSTSTGTEGTTEVETSTSTLFDDLGRTGEVIQDRLGLAGEKKKCKKRKPKRKKDSKKCRTSEFGCCWDGFSVAKGPFGEGCASPHTCKETEFGCCPDEVSPAEGPDGDGCPKSLCAESLFGCCPDKKTFSKGNNFEECPEPEFIPVNCKETEFGCCPDGVKPASGPKFEGCFECEGSGECSSCRDTKYGCCPDGERAATGPKQAGCKKEKCIKSKFGCCPDGKTPAKGKKNKGCPKSACADEKFGCCPDGITPAHGPGKEGCCLLSPFGCCPDNITPARGTHDEGCGCEHSKYGCCPNNVTAALGANKEGCGCSYSTHGCCPDGVTIAPEPSYKGCECHTYQFGCCPDGVTVSKGPQGDGCSCTDSEFGCCSDGTTPAKGPDGAGCTCAESRFGCCPDGVSEAKGPNFEECSDVPVLPGDLCVLPKDRGPCRNFSVKWHYDKEYGGCTRFWYGGCEGNQNRFNSQNECSAVCIQPKGRDVCKLPKIKGPCEGYYPMWHYDAERKQCGQFIHGGCLGNGNKFETRDECHNLCVEPDIGDPCELPVEVGICNGTHSRWHYSKEHQACVPFTYGGCQGNRNNFHTDKACQQQCVKPGKSREVCSLPQVKGACSKRLARWAYDQSKDKCTPFYYTGCDANGNNFVNRKDCETSCPSRVERSICTLPAEVGACHNFTQRWYYDTLKGRCQTFYYGSCGGNHNNFQNFQECERYCVGRPAQPQLPAPQPSQTPDSHLSPEPDRQPSFDTRICFINPVSEDNEPTRDCGLSERKFYYDANTGVCKDFIYTGCGETRNTYDTPEECERQCSNAREPCDLPPVEGPCRSIQRSWYYDRDSNSCQEFNYGGCLGNTNRFEQRRDCESRCVRGPTSTSSRDNVPSAPSSGLPAACEAYPDGGKCKEYVTAWYFNSTSGRCGRFAYGGCAGNGNHFVSEEQCNRTCGEIRGTDVCSQKHAYGSCGDEIDKIYFDSQTGICRPFTYSGCGGNGNRFSSTDECEAVCLRHSELDMDNRENEIEEPRPAKDQCDAAREECSQIKCHYGIERWVDNSNCERCRCRTPCNEQTCPRGTRCNVVPQRLNLPPYTVQYGAECLPELKPGECPEVEADSCAQAQECYYDADCDGDEKCCNNGCGQVCVRPKGSEPALTTQPPDEQKPAPPVIHVPEPQVNASEGNYATLRCIATGYPVPTITWKKDALILQTSGHYRIMVDGSLQIVNLYRTDSGTYICIADNKVGPPIQKIFELQVTNPIPQEAQILGDDRAVVVVKLNAPTELHCHAYGYPAPHLTWWQGNTTVPLSSEVYEQQNDYSLLIRDVRLHTLGPYTCMAYNGIGRASSYIITVKAEGSVSNPSPTEQQYIQYLIPPSRPVTSPEYDRDDRPLTTAPPRPFVAPVVVDISSTLTQYPVGSNISLPCIVNGFPQPTVKWLKDGQPIELSNRIEHTSNNTLEIFDATKSDSGKYTCMASNDYETDSRDITIQVDTMFIHPKCIDNPQFANCALIVKGNYCKHQYYARFCCRSCTLQGQLPPIGPHLQDIASSRGGDLSRSRRHYWQDFMPSFATTESSSVSDDHSNTQLV